MILINLLPHREEKRAARKRAYFAGLAAAVGAGLIAVGLWFAVLSQMKSSQQERNAYLGSEIKISKPRSRTSPTCALKSTR